MKDFGFHQSDDLQGSLQNGVAFGCLLCGHTKPHTEYLAIYRWVVEGIKFAGYRGESSPLHWFVRTGVCLGVSVNTFVSTGLVQQ